jgi:hypothetical protein
LLTALTEISGGANHSRLTSLIYPDRFVLNFDFNYSSGLNDSISRLSPLFGQKRKMLNHQ